MIYLHEDGVEEAMALAFTPPLRFDPNGSVELRRPQNQFYANCDSLLHTLLLAKPNGWRGYVMQLLEAGFRFEGRNHFAMLEQLTREVDDELLDACIDAGLDMHAVRSEQDPSNVLLNSVLNQEPEQFHWLLSRGLDPFMLHRFKEMGRDYLVERSLFGEAVQFCRHNGKANAEDCYIGIPMALLKMGMAKLDRMEDSFIYFKDCFGNQSHMFNPTPKFKTGWGSISSESASERAWERKRFETFRDYLTMSSNLLVNYLHSGLPIEHMSVQELIDIYTVGGLEDLCKSERWRGHEKHLYALSLQMPEHIRADMQRFGFELLAAAEAQIASRSIQTPVQDWGLVSPSVQLQKS